MSKYRRLPVALVAACLTFGLSAGPAVAAPYSDPAAPTAKSAQKKKKKATTESLRKRVVEAEEDLRNTGKGLKYLVDLSKKNQNAVNFLSAAAPQLVNGLVALRDASLQLKGGLETLGAAYTSVEYGAIRLYQRSAATGGEWDEIPGAVVTSSDIPDDGNTATISASLPHGVGVRTEIKVTGTIRTNEQEPEGDEHGQMGGVMYAKCITPADTQRPGSLAALAGVPANSCVDTDPGPAPQGLIPSGSAVCVNGPPEEKDFDIPGGETEQSLIEVDGAAERTDSDRPDKGDNSPTGDNDEVCVLPGAGLYELTASVTFADIPSTSTPGPRE